MKRKAGPKEFLPFRDWLKRYGQESLFRAQYLRDRRMPNHTSLPELQEYLRSSPWASNLQDAKAAWRACSSIPAVKAEHSGYWSSEKPKEQ